MGCVGTKKTWKEGLGLPFQLGLELTRPRDSAGCRGPRHPEKVLFMWSEAEVSPIGWVFRKYYRGEQKLLIPIFSVNPFNPSRYLLLS
jgi:hypothetical protein